MKIPKDTKIVLFTTVILLYLSGAVFFFLHQYGNQSSLHFWSLRLHSTLGLWFLVLFGFLFERHILPSFKSGERRISGLSVVVPFLFLILTVPFLFYLSDENLREIVEGSHSYVGLAIIVPFVLHGLFR